MEFIDHGEWERYVPDPWPEHLRNHPHIMFCRRIGDGIDWYKFQRTQLTEQVSMKMTLLKLGKHLQVQATYRDASYIFPAVHRLIEIDVSGDHERFRRMRFDLAKGEFYEGAPDPVFRTDLLLQMQRAGSLSVWEDAIADSDVPLRLSLSAERPFTEEDDEVIALARKLNWSGAQLKQLFDDARQMIRSRHG
jgi:hypothetical protein